MRWLDDDRASSVKGTTLKEYRRAAAAFVCYLEKHAWWPSGPEEWDDLLVEYAIDEQITPSRFRNTYASIEFFMPNFKGKLINSQIRIGIAQSKVPIRHTVPCGRELGELLSTTLASLGRPRVGIALLVQITLGLRPGELVRLTPADIARSPDPSKTSFVIVRLGAGRGTKAGREQCCLLNTVLHPMVWELLSRVISLTPVNERLFPFTTTTMNTWLRKAQDLLDLNVGITAHSGRAGFASDQIAEGVPAPTVKEAGRWVSEASFRTYIDIIGSLTVAQRLRTQGLQPVLAWVKLHLEEYFPAWSLVAYGRGAGQHPAEAARGRGRGRGSGRHGARRVAGGTTAGGTPGPRATPGDYRGRGNGPSAAAGGGSSRGPVAAEGQARQGEDDEAQGVIVV